VGLREIIRLRLQQSFGARLEPIQRPVGHLHILTGMYAFAGGAQYRPGMSKLMLSPLQVSVMGRVSRRIGAAVVGQTGSVKRPSTD
jgi:hypothetical protein